MDLLGKLLGNFTIENDNGEHLFRIYFYEDRILFDEKFLNGIANNDKTMKRFQDINKVWHETKEKNNVVEEVMGMLADDQEYLSQFFYNEKERAESNKLLNNPGSRSTKIQDKNTIYFSYLKNHDKLKEIEREQFEKKITDKEIGEYYVENFEIAKNSSKFYKYKSSKDKDCYIMVVNNRIKIGFAE